MLYTADYNDIDLKVLLDRELVEVHFQPIFSIREKKMIGFEGLSRGIHPISGKLIPPLPLLKLAKDADLTLELDRLFRKKILETFKFSCPPPHDLILSLNFETSVIDEEIGTLQLIQLCRQLNLNPSNIVIEILESKVRSVEALAKFVHIHREHGFLVALDDVGKGHSNLDRIPVIQPDVIKIDRSLVTNLQDDYYRQEIFKALIHLSQKIGAVALAEGVETEEETLTCLELGADLLQGYYFSKPQDPGSDFAAESAAKIDLIADKFRKHMVDKLNIRKMQHERYGLMIDNFVAEFSKMDTEEMDGKVATALLSDPVAKAIYVLDAAGRQATIMSCKADLHPRQGIFRLPPKGTDYSLRDYFYALVEPGFHRESYTSEPYISPATGLFCLTISARFKDKNGNTMILCVDVVPTYLKHMGRIMTLFH
ncbi:MAG TPA: EAL domain-containing protein, partial [bacterium]|nr:EAL domain-containing protein [bacterium]